jgi:tRNA threonylcarbamoyladenosine biosynthesis protein TsaB
MNVLAFDTCMGSVSVAVRWQSAGREWLMREACELRETGHAERLTPMIAEVMDSAGLGFGAIDRLAVTIGPGSFTGVRVGVAAARGLALAMGKPVVGMTSLAALAHRADLMLGGMREGRQLAVAVDARRGMVYLQLFGADPGGASFPRLVFPEQAADIVPGNPLVVVGSGAAAVASALAAAGRRAEVLLTDLQPHAQTLALLAADLAPARPLRPFYLRPPDVKPQADKSLTRAVP